MTMTMIIINVGLLIVALILAKTNLQQEKLILSYDNCLKLKENMQRLMHLAKLAKVKGHDMVITYSTISDFYYVSFYEKRKSEYESFYKKITNDEEFEEAIKYLERLIK